MQNNVPKIVKVAIVVIFLILSTFIHDLGASRFDMTRVGISR